MSFTLPVIFGGAFLASLLTFVALKILRLYDSHLVFCLGWLFGVTLAVVDAVCQQSARHWACRPSECCNSLVCFGYHQAHWQHWRPNVAPFYVFYLHYYYFFRSFLAVKQIFIFVVLWILFFVFSKFSVLWKFNFLRSRLFFFS